MKLQSGRGDQHQISDSYDEIGTVLMNQGTICYCFHYTWKFQAQMTDKVISGEAYENRSAGFQAHHPISQMQ